MMVRTEEFYAVGWLLRPVLLEDVGLVCRELHVKGAAFLLELDLVLAGEPAHALLDDHVVLVEQLGQRREGDAPLGAQDFPDGPRRIPDRFHVHAHSFETRRRYRPTPAEGQAKRVR